MKERILILAEGEFRPGFARMFKAMGRAHGIRVVDVRLVAGVERLAELSVPDAATGHPGVPAADAEELLDK